MSLMDRARAQLRLWQRRFDSRAPRERVLLTLAAVALCLMLADGLWFGAAYKGWQVATRRLQTAQQALDALQADSARLQASGDAQARAQQAELNSWRQRVRDGDAGLRSYEDSLVGPERMLELLEQMLARHGQVRVRAMHSLGRSDLLDPAASPAAPAGMVATRPGSPNSANSPNAPTPQAPNTAAAAFVQPGTAATAPSLYRHGVELTLDGGFADLLSYLRTLEAMPQRLLWGSVELRVEHYPRSLLKLRLYTVSRDRNWLEI